MIHPEFKPLIEIINNKLFRIPEYQRHYSWQKKQRDELFRDIKKIKSVEGRSEEKTHFMATIVCLKTKDKEPVGSDTFYVYDVVDGQQRITTLIVLLKSISIKLRKEAQKSDHIKLDEANKIDRILVKDDARLIILQSNHDNRLILRNYLQNGSHSDDKSIKTIADRNMIQAIKECERFVNSDSDIVKLLAVIKNNLYFIFHSLEDKGSVYTIFEVLNSRGLDVDWLDKCKSLLMGLLYENTATIGRDDTFNQHLNELHSYWSEIYKEIGTQEIPGHEIIRFAATLKEASDAGRPLSSEDAINFFKSDCEVQENVAVQKILDNTIWLKEVTSCLASLYKDKRRIAVTDITQARLLAVSIMLRQDLPEESRKQLLDQWEKTTFRIFGFFRKDSRTKVGEYVRVAKFINKNKDSSLDHLLRLIANIGNEFPINKAIELLKSNDAYNGWESELRYFLFRYEESLLKNNEKIDETIWNEIWQASANNTIEHIMPQDEKARNWKHISSDAYKLLHNIGNLCLLSPHLNSEANSKNFEHKKLIYKKANLLMLNEIIHDNFVESRWVESRWDENSISKRRDKMLKFAKEEWSDII